MSDKIERNSSIELLRIIAMLGVVILHYNNSSVGGGFRYVVEASINQYYLYFVENLFICAVDLFVMISAYFLCMTKKRRLIKIVELVLQTIVFQLVFYVARTIINGEQFCVKNIIECLLPINYFVVLYSVVYILSPYIDLLIEGLSKPNFRKFVVTLLLLFSVWTILVDFLENIKGVSLTGLSTVGAYGSQYGYSIVNFVLVYVVGAYIKISELKISKKKTISIIGVILGFLYFCSITEHKLGLTQTTAWNYNNPLIIVLSAMIIILFIQIKINSKIINELAKGVFTCYLIHSAFIGEFHIEEIVLKNIFILIGHQLLVAVILYGASYIVYKIYSLCSRWLIQLITPICDKINLSID